LPTALQDGTLDGSELDVVTAAVRLLPGEGEGLS